MKRPAIILLLAAALAAAVMLFKGCNKEEPAPKKEPVHIKAQTPDAILPLVKALADAYSEKKPEVTVDLSAGSSSAGIAALHSGAAEISFSRRELKPREHMESIKRWGSEAGEFLAGYDALAVYTHPSNPLKEISMPELTEMWAAGGSITKWDQLGNGFTGDILFVGRPPASDTSEVFAESVCRNAENGKTRGFRKGISELATPAAVVDTVGKTPAAIGYAGMTYKTDAVNRLKISPAKGQPALEPDAASVRSGAWPLFCRLYIYSAPGASPASQAFVDWCLSPEGQAVVSKLGFVPLK